MDPGDLLKGSLFSSLPADKVRELAQLARVQEFSEGDLILKEGDGSTKFYWIRDGLVEVHPLKGEPTRLGRGEFFGEAALVSKLRRASDVLAIRKTRCLVFEGAELRSYPALLLKILETADKRQTPPETVHQQAQAEDKITFTSTKTRLLFDHIVRCFTDDYMVERMPLEQSGWRSLNEVSKHIAMPADSLLGRNGVFGPTVRELLSRGLIESRVFKGQRGRGGSVTKVRLAYDKEPVKRYVDRAVSKPK